MAEKVINIGGRLHDTSINHTVTGANEVLDDDLQKKQSEINREYYGKYDEIYSIIGDKEYEFLKSSGMGRINLPKNPVGFYTTWMFLPSNGNVYLLYSPDGSTVYGVYDSQTGKGLGFANNIIVEIENYDPSDLPSIVDGHYLSYTEDDGVYTITLPDDSTITSTDLNPMEIFRFQEGGNYIKHILTQEMINEENTIYVVQYDYELNSDINIPNGCILEFDGGIIDGGENEYSLIDNYNTQIIAPNAKIFGENITLSGNWNIEGHITWFGASPLNEDNTAAIQKAFDSFSKVVIDKGNYVTDALVMTKARMIFSKENEIREAVGLTFVFKTNNKTGIKVQRYADNPYYKLENIGIAMGNLPAFDRDHPYIDGTVGVDITDSSSYSQPIYCYDCKFIGFEIAVKSDNHSYYNKFVRCYFTRLKYGLYWVSPNGTLVDSCIASFFERFYNNGAGLGPLNIINSNFEQFKGAILYSSSSIYHLNLENNYVESPKGNCVVGRFMNIVSKGNMIEVEKAFGTIYWMYASESIISIGNYIRIDDGCVEGLDPSAPQIPSFKYFDVYTGEPGQEAIYTDKLVLAHLEDIAYVPINPNPEIPDTEGRYFNLENYIKYRARIGFDNIKRTSIIIGRDPISGNGYTITRKAIEPTVGNGYYFSQDGRYACCHYGDGQLSFIGVLSKTEDIISEGQRNIATIDMTSFATPGRFAFEYVYFKVMDSDYNPVILKLNLASTGDNSPFGSIDYIKGDTTKDILLDGCVINLF